MQVEWGRFFGSIRTLVRWLFVFVAGSAIILGLALWVSTWLDWFHKDGTTGDDLTGWLQAVGAVFAIVAGFVATAWQMDRQRNEAVAAERASAQAALLLARDAVDAVTERLEAALKPKDLALRGARTDELVASLREFDMTRMPSAMLPDFNRLRSCAAAVNGRLEVVYISEQKADYTGQVRDRSKRTERLKSAVEQRNDAEFYYVNLQLVATSKYKVATFQLKPAPLATAYPQV